MSRTESQHRHGAYTVRGLEVISRRPAMSDQPGPLDADRHVRELVHGARCTCHICARPGMTSQLAA